MSTIEADNVIADNIDARNVGTMTIGTDIATKVEIADTGIITEVQGNLDALEGIDVTGNITATGYTEFADISAPANPGAGLGRLYKKTGDDGLFWKPDAAGPEVDLTADVDTGESNTASNVGAGADIFKQKSLADLEFRGILAASSKISAAVNGDNIDIDVVTGNIDHGGLAGLADDDHTQYALLAGRGSGQTLQGGTAAGEDLTLESTSNASKGTIIALDPLEVDDIDARTATTLLVGKSTATKVEIADTGIITEVQGNLDALEGIDVTGNITQTGYSQFADISAPANAGAGLGRLYKKTGDDGIFWKPDAAGPEVDLTADTGESNTSSNVGAGADIFKQKTGVDFEFRGILAASSKVSAVVNGDNIDIDINEGNIDHGSLAGLGDDDHTQYTLLAGRAGGQILQGGTASGEDLTLESTSNATKGTIIALDPIESNEYIEFADISAPANPGSGLGRLYKKTGDDGIFWKPDAAGPEVDLTDTGAGGETNTASNVGAGADIFKQKTGVDFEFRGILAASSKVTAVVNADNIDIDAVPDNIMPGTTKGDVIVHTGTTHVRLPVGTDDYFLVADSGESTGLRWRALNGRILVDSQTAESTVTTSTSSPTFVNMNAMTLTATNNGTADYMIMFSTSLMTSTASSSSMVHIRIVVNGTPVASSERTERPVNSNSDFIVTTSHYIAGVANGDIIAIQWKSVSNSSMTSYAKNRSLIIMGFEPI